MHNPSRPVVRFKVYILFAFQEMVSFQNFLSFQLEIVLLSMSLVSKPIRIGRNGTKLFRLLLKKSIIQDATFVYLKLICLEISG